jgi:hypothetical protein
MDLGTGRYAEIKGTSGQPAILQDEGEFVSSTIKVALAASDHWTGQSLAGVFIRRLRSPSLNIGALDEVRQDNRSR